MMITDYFKFIKQENRKSRFDLTAYSEPFYSNDNFNPALKPSIYIINNPNIKASNKRKSYWQIDWNGKHLSSLFYIDIAKPEFSYGDIYKTDDFVLFYKSNDILEMFIFRGKKHFRNLILDMLLDGELQREIEQFREKAVLFLPAMAEAGK